MKTIDNQGCPTHFDAVWYRSPEVLLRRPFEFFPARGMTPAERLNSIVRFILYGSVLVALYRNDATVLGIGLAVALVVSGVDWISARKGHTMYGKDDTRRTSVTACTAPTRNNPFMNTLTNEYSTDKQIACRQTPCIDRQTKKYFEKGLVRELSDVYHKRASDRQYYTMPVTGNGTPDTRAFRNFLFSETAKGPRCK